MNKKVIKNLKLLVKNMKDLDASIVKLVNEKFWELIEQPKKK